MVTFEKKHSKIMYGVAILIMLQYHMFYYINVREIFLEGLSFLDMIWPNLLYTLSKFGGVCVQIFAFISGYGFAKKFHSASNSGDLSKDYKYVFKHLYSFFRQYWIVFFILVPFGLWMGYVQFDMHAIRNSIIGLDGSLYGPWWYVKEYVVMIIAIPWIAVVERIGEHVNKNKVIIQLLFSVLAACAYIAICHYLQIRYHEDALTVCLGYFCAKYNILKTPMMLTGKKRIWNYLLCIILLVVAVWSVIMSGQDMWVRALITASFVYACVCLLTACKWISNVLAWLGEHSIYIWLTHILFIEFLCKEFIASIKVCFLMYLLALAISVLAAIILKQIEKFFNKHQSPLDKLVNEVTE